MQTRPEYHADATRRLQMAIQNSKPENAIKALRDGADPNAVLLGGQNAYYLGVTTNSVKLIRKLIKLKATPEISIRLKTTPQEEKQKSGTELLIDLAKKNGNTEIISLLEAEQTKELAKKTKEPLIKRYTVEGTQEEIDAAQAAVEKVRKEKEAKEKETERLRKPQPPAFRRHSLSIHTSGLAGSTRRNSAFTPSSAGSEGESPAVLHMPAPITLRIPTGTPTAADFLTRYTSDDTPTTETPTVSAQKAEFAAMYEKLSALVQTLIDEKRKKTTLGGDSKSNSVEARVKEALGLDDSTNVSMHLSGLVKQARINNDHAPIYSPVLVTLALMLEDTKMAGYILNAQTEEAKNFLKNPDNTCGIYQAFKAQAINNASLDITKFVTAFDMVPESVVNQELLTQINKSKEKAATELAMEEPHGYTPVHLAVRRDDTDPETYKELKRQNLDFNAKDKQGNPPLSYVKSLDVLKILFGTELDLKLSLENHGGRTPYSLIDKDNLKIHKEEKRDTQPPPMKARVATVFLGYEIRQKIITSRNLAMYGVNGAKITYLIKQEKPLTDKTKTLYAKNIISYIFECTSQPVLEKLHRELCDTSFDKLRECTGLSSYKTYKLGAGMVETSETWAWIEKAMTVQWYTIQNNFKNNPQNSHFIAHKDDKPRCIDAVKNRKFLGFFSSSINNTAELFSPSSKATDQEKSAHLKKKKASILERVQEKMKLQNKLDAATLAIAEAPAVTATIKHDSSASTQSMTSMKKK